MTLYMKESSKTSRRIQNTRLTEYTCSLGPYLTHGKCAKIVVTKKMELRDWNQEYFSWNQKPDTEEKQENS